MSRVPLAAAGDKAPADLGDAAREALEGCRCRFRRGTWPAPWKPLPSQAPEEVNPKPPSSQATSAATWKTPQCAFVAGDEGELDDLEPCSRRARRRGKGQPDRRR